MPSAWLQDEYVRRKKVNPRYSLRAFARRLGVPSGPLSEILSGKRNLTPYIGDRIARALNLANEERARFLSLAEVRRPRTTGEHVVAIHPNVFELPPDLQREIVDWFHFAILGYLALKDIDCNRRKIAARLGIRVLDITLAINRLLTIGLLRPSEGTLIPTYSAVRVNNATTSPETAQAYELFLQRALWALNTVPATERSSAFLTLAIDPERLPEARERIRLFEKSLARFLGSGNRRTLYSLGVVLTPLSSRESTVGNGRN